MGKGFLFQFIFLKGEKGKRKEKEAGRIPTKLMTMVDSLVYGRHGQVPHSGWLVNSRNVLLTVLQAEKPKVKAQADSVPHEGPVPASQTVSVPTRGERELARVSPERHSFCSLGVHPHDPRRPHLQARHTGDEGQQADTIYVRKVLPRKFVIISLGDFCTVSM